jgi:hypothetical protein
VGTGNRNVVTGNELAQGIDARNITDITQVVGIEVNSQGNTISNNMILNFYDNIIIKSIYNIVSHNIIPAANNDAIVLDGTCNNNEIHGNVILSSVIGIETKNVPITDCNISHNMIKACKQEAIKVGASSLAGCTISNNHISDNGTLADNTYSAIKILCNVSIGMISNNLIRNTGSGKMKYGIEFITGKTADDFLVSNNITRNMKSTYGYVMPSVGITQSSNIGTVTTPV